MPLAYLDNAATTPVTDQVRAALMPFLGDEFGNPSSRHALGIRAAEALDQARRQIAHATGVRAQQVTFTSGGTEANNLAVLGAARARGPKGRIVIGPTEHPSVREAGQALAREGFDLQFLPLDSTGNLDLEKSRALLTEDTQVVAQMLVNNEVGTIYPVAALAQLVRSCSPKAHLHVDAVQGLGKVSLDLQLLGADSLAVSSHKVHGLKGTGALITQPNHRFQPLVYGGGQQGGLRPGTENVLGAAAFGAAAGEADRVAEQTWAHSAGLRTQLAAGLAGLSAINLLEPGTSQVPSICSLIVEGAPAEVWQHHLEQHEVLVSVGSACQSNDSAISPALTALGLDPERARRVLRLSFSAYSTADEVDRAIQGLAELAPTLAQQS